MLTEPSEVQMNPPPICGKCRGVMTRENARLRPELFLHDGCLPDELKPTQPRVTNHGLDTDGAVFFYEQDFYVLSNFSAFNVYYRGYDFDTSEQAYHWAKFAPDGNVPTHCKQDDASYRLSLIRGEILQTRSAHDAFKLAEKYAAERRPDWNDIRLIVMGDILRAKARQHEYVRRKLLQTGDRALVENSWRCSFWGWGEDQQGHNMLGKLWMEVRAELREAQSC